MTTNPAYAQQGQATNPGQTMGILSIVFAVLVPLVGLILGILARSKSKNAGASTTLGTVGIVLAIVVGVINGILFATVFSDLMASSTV